MTAAEALRQGIARLRAAGVADPPRDARILLAHVMSLAPERLTLHLGEPMSGAAAAAYDDALAARVRRQPVSQIVGLRLFWGRAFRVTPDVLDPRPETEVLVAAALEEPFARVADLGTGSGAILLTLLAETPSAEGVGVDRLDAALAVACDNARRLGLEGRATFLASDWTQGLAGTFDLIVSNPPYISEDEMTRLAPEVRDWEPRMALTPGGDGLDAYRRIAAGAGEHLAPGGRLILEIGPTQAGAVCRLLVAAGFSRLEVRRDLDGRDRVVLARKSTD